MYYDNSIILLHYHYLFIGFLSVGFSGTITHLLIFVQVSAYDALLN